MVELDFKSLMGLIIVLILGVSLSQAVDAPSRVAGLFLLIVAVLVISGHIKLKT